ncbi:MAG: ATP-binding protein [Snowella sp.]|nr:ATP-binding protein [Snowella sp.]
MLDTLSQTLPSWLENAVPLFTTELTTTSETSAVTQVLEWLQQSRPDFVPTRPWLECQTVIIEGFENVLKHAHRHLSSETAIALCLQIYSQGMEVEIWDYGEPFDLLSALEQVPEKQLVSVDHGRGLILMRRILDYISYTRIQDGRNCLRMIKAF